jgi:prefoldin subunit 5
MAYLAEIEALQTQMEELRDQLETLRTVEAHRGQSKDVSLERG